MASLCVPYISNKRCNKFEGLNVILNLLTVDENMLFATFIVFLRNILLDSYCFVL